MRSDAARGLLELVLATARMATQVWPDVGSPAAESWRTGWRRLWGEGVPSPLASFEEGPITVRLFPAGRLLIEREDSAQLYQLRIEGAAPTSLERACERLRGELASRIADFVAPAPTPSRRER
jgi:hypothetical protein